MSGEVIDLFAGGLGGFDLALRSLGIDPLGIEWDDAACATREACGLRTLQADVSELDPLDFAPVIGVAGGPPCPAWSMAGKGEGRDAMPFYTGAIERMGRGEQIDRAEMDAACGDERAHLVLEPLRWALALLPRWIVLEQVPPVLPLWEAMCGVLRSRGYSATCAVLSAEQFGVPQTRKRAFLIASLDGPVSMPAPTHQRYIAPRRRETERETDALFAVPEPERIVAPEDRGLLPWRSMADALGWGLTAAPTTSVVTPRGGGCETSALDGGSGARRRYSDAKAAGAWEFRATNDRPNGASRCADAPAPALAFGHNAPRWVLDTGNTRGGTREAGRARAADAPAPAITSRADQLEWRDEEPDTSPFPTHYDRRQVGGDGTPVGLVPVDHPAPTVGAQGPAKGRDVWVTQRPAPTVLGSRRSEEGLLVGKQMAPGEARNVGGHGWVDTRPATTVNGDPRISEPGHHDSDVSGSQQANAVRVSLQEALVLQDFDPATPVQGSKSKAFQQVGNAVPVGLALAAVSVVV